MRRAANTQHETRNTKPLVPLLLAWFSENARDLPWRRTRDPYGIWVSEIMLQQTQVKTVIPYWERWMRELPTIESLAKAMPEKIHKLWEGLGYYTRVRNMQNAAQQIVANGRRRGDESQIKSKLETPHVVSYEFPNTFDDVLALPGIGRYTAGAICSIAFNQPTPILDGNVIRVLTRVFSIAENPREKNANQLLWQLAEELVSHAKAAKDAKEKNPLRASRPLREPNSCSALNQSLMELGALVCIPRDPKCHGCPIAKHCFAFQNNRVSEFPNLDKRPVVTARRFAAFVMENEGNFLVRQRPHGVVNAHLWEFPNIELNGAPANPSAVAKELFGFIPKNVKALCTIKHSITRYRITVEAFYAAAPNRLKAELQTKWLPISELHKLSFPSAHKKILKALVTTSGTAGVSPASFLD
jgi:A/G-specific adenine glycosylase